MKSLKLAPQFFTIFIFALLLVNCSKEKKLERTLHKKDGQWNIDNVSWQKVIQDGSGQNVSIGTSANVGTFTFDKDGAGSYSFTIDGVNYSQSFGWSVSGTNISIVKVSQTVSLLGNVDQLAIAFTGTETGKKAIKLEGSETHQFVGGSITQTVLSGTFSLTKN